MAPLAIMKDLFSVLFEDGGFSGQPVLVLDEDMRVFSFNPEAGNLFPGLASGYHIDKFATLCDKERLRIKAEPSAAVIISEKNTAYIASFCPIKVGYRGYFAVCITASDENGAYEYMAGRLAVLSKCLTELGVGSRYLSHRLASHDTSVRTEDLCKEIYRCRSRVETVVSLDGGPRFAADPEAFLEKIFSFYRAIRFSGVGNHYDIASDGVCIFLSSFLCIVLTDAFHQLTELSSDSHVSVRVRTDGEKTSVRMFCTPSYELLHATEYKVASDLYGALGFRYTDMEYTKKLAALNGWQAGYYFDGEAFNFVIEFDKDGTNSRIRTYVPEDTELIEDYISILLT